MHFFGDVLQSLNCGVLVVDREQRIVYCNRWFLEKGSLSEQELIGERITMLFTRFEKQRLSSALKNAIEYGISSVLSYSLHENIFPLFQHNGKEIDHAIAIRSMGDSAGHILIQVTDISSSTKRERSLRDAHRMLEESSRAKEEFLAVMSHELRTPLTTIIGNSELLAEQVTDDENGELIRSIEIAGRNQLALVNDILDMSKIESGKFAINNHPFGLSTILDEMEQMFRSRAQDKGLELTIRQKNVETHKLIGDIQRISQILINLLGNAIKFTEEGVVSLTTDIKDGNLLFKVRDTGIGITDEMVGRLFTRFEQADSSISRRYGGSGLGLYVSKMLVDLMGGEIMVESELGVGSTFIMKLPYRQSDVSLQMDGDGHVKTRWELSIRGRVLVVEDTVSIQVLIKKMVESVGATVDVAANGKEAIELAMTTHYDLILMDMQMPVMDGIEATRILRASGNSTPIIALTANVLQKHRDLFKEAGCDSFLGKPVNRDALYRLLKRFLPVDTSDKSLQ